MKQSVQSSGFSFFNILCKNIIIIAGVLLMAAPAYAGVIYAQKLTVQDYKEGFRLEWSTSQENGSELFVIEQSGDGVNYQSIGVVKAKGDSEELKKYHFNDLQLGITTTYYRLRQSDRDGTSFLSASVKVSKFAPVNYVISGIEKEKDGYLIFIESVTTGSIILSLQDLKGEKLVREEFVLEKGLNEYRMDLGEEPPGDYSLIAKKGAEFSIRNFKILSDPEREKDRMSSKERKKGG